MTLLIGDSFGLILDCFWIDWELINNFILVMGNLSNRILKYLNVDIKNLQNSIKVALHENNKFLMQV